MHAGQLPTVFCGRLQPYRLQEKGVAFGFAGSPCFFFPLILKQGLPVISTLELTQAEPLQNQGDKTTRGTASLFDCFVDDLKTTKLVLRICT